MYTLYKKYKLKKRKELKTIGFFKKISLQMSFKDSDWWRFTDAKRQIIPLPWRSNADQTPDLHTSLV